MVNLVFSSILWEYNLEKIDYDSDILFVRTLTLWDKEHLEILKNNLWKKLFKNKFLKNISSFDKITLNYWWIVLWIDVKKYLLDNQNTYEKFNEPIFTRNFGW